MDMTGMELDADLEALKKKQRAKKMKTLAIVVAVPVCIALWALPFGGAIESQLEQDGYSNVEVERSGLFSFTFEANKGAAKCTGSITKMPGSSRSTNFCTTGNGDADLSSN